MGDGLAAGVKPYEDRNFIGKFFHNRDGSLNSNAVMALIGGLAKGAEAQTISPLGGILSGLGGGMETYKQLLKQTPEVAKANIENADSFQKLYLRAVEGFGYKGTPEEYAREIGYIGPMPYGGDATGGGSPSSGQRTYRGAVLDPFGRGLTQEIELPNVGSVQAGQVYGYLKSLEAEMQRAQSLGITVDPQAVADLRAKIAAHTGQIQTANGPVEDPTYTEALFGTGATVRDVEQSNTIAQGINETLTAAREAVRNTDELAKALETMPSVGPLSPWYAGAQGIAGQLGLTEDLDYATAMQISGKSIAEQARSAVASLAGTADTSMVRELVEQSTPRGTMTPAAIEELLAIRAGAAAYNEAYHQAAADALAQDPAANVAEVQRKFAQEHKPTDYIEEMRPRYKGMFVPDAASSQGVTQEEWRNLPAEDRQVFLD
jgi:enamine deaminase RidA (YjgF/YER057c/UK114 family)